MGDVANLQTNAKEIVSAINEGWRIVKEPYQVNRFYGRERTTPLSAAEAYSETGT